jgi:glycosyltransferase involved in cell wall biosynthesis
MLFSIVIPVYNRERFIGRCLASLFSQDFANFEVIAVDDGSTDASLACLRDCADPRLSVIAHGENRGVGPARNSAIAAARGDWIIPLDSDDELVAGALSRLREHALAAPPDVHALWFRCRMDDGSLSPDPMPSRREWDYEGYLGFLEETRGRWRDMLRCVRRTCFDRLSYPENRMLEDKFHLDFARRFRSRNHPEVMRLYHQDADNRMVDHLRRLDPVRDRAFLQDRIEGLAALLREHGPAMARVAPETYGDRLQLAATAAIFARRRLAAFGYAAQLARRFPMRRRAWVLLGASLAGPALVRRLQALAGRRS